MTEDAAPEVNDDRRCAFEGCDQEAIIGDWCELHAADAPEDITKKVAIGCLGVIVGLVLLVMAGSAINDWITGANDPNREGSAAWCARNRVPDEYCGLVRDQAKRSGITPTEYIERFSDQALGAGTSDGRICAVDLGSAWPLSVDCVNLYCEGSGAVSLEYGGVRYAVNGLGEMAGYADIEPIWAVAADPQLAASGLKQNIGPLIDRGLAMCD